MPKKILVIDDDPVILQGVSLFLREAGYEVNAAREGDEALDQIN